MGGWQGGPGWGVGWQAGWGRVGYGVAGRVGPGGGETGRVGWKVGWYESAAENVHTE